MSVISAYAAAFQTVTVLSERREKVYLDRSQQAAHDLRAAIADLRAVAQPAGSSVSDAERALYADVERLTGLLSDHPRNLAEHHSSVASASSAAYQWWGSRRSGNLIGPHPEQAEVRARQGDPDPQGKLAEAARYAEEIPARIEAEKPVFAGILRRTTHRWTLLTAIAVATVALAVITRRRRYRIALGSPHVRLAAEVSVSRRRFVRRLHVASAFVGRVLIGCAILAFAFLVRIDLVGDAWPVLVAVVASTLLVGVPMVTYSVPRTARSAVDALAVDGRGPVVYLRSFGDDAAAAVSDNERVHWQLRAFAMETREEVLAAVLGLIGPVIACGRPGEELPPRGAARFYLRPFEWQPVVGRFIDTARLVVIRVGEGPGVRWELEYAVGHVSPSRLILVLAGASLSSVTLAWLNRSLPFPLPPAEPRDPTGGIDVVVRFSPDWRPAVVTADAVLLSLPRWRRPRASEHLTAHMLGNALAAGGYRTRDWTWPIDGPRLTRFLSLLWALPTIGLVLSTYRLIVDW